MQLGHTLSILCRIGFELIDGAVLAENHNFTQAIAS